MGRTMDRTMGRMRINTSMSATSRLISLAQLTALPLPPPLLVQLAADTGYGACGIRLLAATPGGAGYPLHTNPALMRETLACMRGTGVRVLDIEIIRIVPGFDARAFSACLEAGAALGARHVLVAGNDDDPSRMAASFAALCDMAAPLGMSCDLEPMPWCPVATVPDAIRVLDAADRPNAGVLIDALHFFRSASTRADIERLPRTRLNYMQICDAGVPPPSTVDALIHDARCARLLPGEGGLDLKALVSALPADMPVAVEIPNDVRVAASGHKAWARAALIATKGLLQPP